MLHLIYGGNGFNVHGDEKKTTFSDRGYNIRLRVDGGNSNYASNGGTYDGITMNCSGTNRTGSCLIVTFTLRNTTNEVKTVDLGVHADVMIDTNDKATVTRLEGDRGLEMMHGNQRYSVLLRSASSYGVDDVSTIWFGQYSNAPYNVWNNTSVNQISDIDSEMAFSWQGIQIPAYGTVTRSFAMIL